MRRVWSLRYSTHYNVIYVINNIDCVEMALKKVLSLMVLLNSFVVKNISSFVFGSQHSVSVNNFRYFIIYKSAYI